MYIKTDIMLYSKNKICYTQRLILYVHFHFDIITLLLLLFIIYYFFIVNIIVTYTFIYNNA